MLRSEVTVNQKVYTRIAGELVEVLVIAEPRGRSMQFKVRGPTGNEVFRTAAELHRTNDPLKELQARAAKIGK